MASPTLPPLPAIGPHDHPEPRTYFWTVQEIAWIKAYAERYARAALAAQQAAESHPLAAPTAESILRAALPYAEWHDKHIHPYHGEAFQNWTLGIYLPVKLSEKDKSPEAALNRLLGIPAPITDTGEQR